MPPSPDLALHQAEKTNQQSKSKIFSRSESIEICSSLRLILLLSEKLRILFIMLRAIITLLI